MTHTATSTAVRPADRAVPRILVVGGGYAGRDRSVRIIAAISPRRRPRRTIPKGSCLISARRRPIFGSGPPPARGRKVRCPPRGAFRYSCLANSFLSAAIISAGPSALAFFACGRAFIFTRRAFFDRCCRAWPGASRNGRASSGKGRPGALDRGDVRRFRQRRGCNDSGD